MEAPRWERWKAPVLDPGTVAADPPPKRFGQSRRSRSWNLTVAAVSEDFSAPRGGMRWMCWKTGNPVHQMHLRIPLQIVWIRRFKTCNMYICLFVWGEFMKIVEVDTCATSMKDHGVDGNGNVLCHESWSHESMGRLPVLGHWSHVRASLSMCQSKQWRRSEDARCASV